MMKLVKDATGKVIAFGSGDEYQPFIADGNTLVEVEDDVAQPEIDLYVAELKALAP